jgi:hypothetical protein
MKPFETFVRRTTLAALAVLGPACLPGRPYIYQPSTVQMANVQGQAAAVYPVPPERPEGEVRLLSLGLVEMEPAPGATKVLTLHVRFIVANNGDATPMVLDTRDVTIDVPGEGRAGAMYANTDVGAMPTVSIARGEQRMVDFYFPVPGPVRNPDALPAFDLRWQVQTGARVVAERTPFQRIEVVPPQSEPRVTVVAGWAPFWWFAPRHHIHAFVHRPLVVIPVHPRAVVVRRHTWRR